MKVTGNKYLALGLLFACHVFYSVALRDATSAPAAVDGTSFSASTVRYGNLPLKSHNSRRLNHLFGRFTHTGGEYLTSTLDSIVNTCVYTSHSCSERRATPPCDSFIGQCPSHEQGRLFSKKQCESFQLHEQEHAWRTSGERFLVLFCNFGRESNRVRCIKHTMVIAGILNRTLVVEMMPRKYDRAKIDYRLLFDIQHVRECYGERSILTTEEYVAKFNETLIIDRVKCWGEFLGGCNIDRDHFGVANGDVQIPSSVPTEFVYKNKSEASTRPMNRETFMQELGDDKHRTIMIGSTFYVGNSESNGSKWDSMFRTADIPFTRTPTCPNGLALQPHSALLEAAKMFVSGHMTLKSGNFLGVHIRRTDFLKKYALNVFTIPLLVECIRNATVSFGLTTIFLVTDAAQDEMVELLSLLQERGPKDEVPLDIVTLPSYWRWREQRKTSWVSRIIRSQLPIKWETYVLLNKLVCAQAALFLGTQMSTFSWDIERLRYGLGRASCHDIELCYDGRGWVPVNLDGG